MAALAPETVDQSRKSYEHKHGPTSHGRGGAGNIKDNPDETPVDPSTLITPTIKSAIYTTGRGGTGNMAKNDNAEEARRAQDVVPVPHKDPASQNQHVGRGGGGNVFRATKEDVEHAKNNGENIVENAAANGTETVKGHQSKKSLVERAREFLGGKK